MKRESCSLKGRIFSLLYFETINRLNSSRSTGSFVFSECTGVNRRFVILSFFIVETHCSTFRTLFFHFNYLHGRGKIGVFSFSPSSFLQPFKHASLNICVSFIERINVAACIEISKQGNVFVPINCTSANV